MSRWQDITGQAADLEVSDLRAGRRDSPRLQLQDRSDRSDGRSSLGGQTLIRFQQPGVCMPLQPRQKLSLLQP